MQSTADISSDGIRQTIHLPEHIHSAGSTVRVRQDVQTGTVILSLKRSLGGTYISVEPFHLDAYVAEQVFRYNNRKDADDFTRFSTCIMGVQGKQLTYKALTQRPSVN